jgi:hypothetical protein
MNYEAVPNHQFRIILLWAKLFNVVSFANQFTGHWYFLSTLSTHHIKIVRHDNSAVSAMKMKISAYYVMK